MNEHCGALENFQEKCRSRLLKDLAANYDQVKRCYCAHKDRIQSVQENLKYYKRMAFLQAILIILAGLVLLSLAFLIGLGTGFGLTNSPYGRRPCVSSIPFWRDDCPVAF